MMSLWTVYCINDVTASSELQQWVFVNLCVFISVCVEGIGEGWSSASFVTRSDLDACEWMMGGGEESGRRRCTISLSSLLSCGFPLYPDAPLCGAYSSTASLCVHASELSVLCFPTAVRVCLCVQTPEQLWNIPLAWPGLHYVLMRSERWGVKTCARGDTHQLTVKWVWI